MFSKQTYQDRRKTLKGLVQKGVIVLLGNIENPINFEHNTYPFRQDSTFLYYFGIQSPKIAAVIDLDEDREIIFGDELSLDDIVWTGKQETLLEKANQSGISITQPLPELSGYIGKAQQLGRTIHYLPPYQSASKIWLSNLLDISISALAPSPELIKAVVKQRSVKEEQEIVQIEEAIRVSTEMHLLAMQVARPGMKEYEIVNAIQHRAADMECTFAYPPIVTIRGEILHNHYSGHTIQNGDMILNDSGAETSMGYAGDLTRTFPAGRSFTARQRELYDVVLKSFTDARTMLRPGVPFKEVHLQAAKSLVEGLIAVGLMKGDPDDAVRNHAHTMFFQCGLGHIMGLDVHDMEDLGEQYVGYTEDNPKDTTTFGLKSLRLGKELETGFVLTVEPGIYIIPDLIDMWKAERKHTDFINYDKLESYRDFGGIRIEDDFLITDDSYRLLGPELIKTADEIENYRQRYV